MDDGSDSHKFDGIYHTGELTPARHQMPTKTIPSLSKSAGQERETTTINSGSRQKHRENTEQLASQANQTRLREISLIYYQSDQSQVKKNKIKP